jgi:transcriptional regulator with GAF, ATPase, and Fis domain
MSWIGGHDLNSTDSKGRDRGPVISTLSTQKFDRVELLYNYPQSDVNPYLDWLKKQTGMNVNAHFAKLSSPIHFGEIYLNANALLEELAESANNQDLNILLSPGTPAMQAVWILLAKTRFKATFWESSREQGVQVAEIPFDIAAEYIPAAGQISGKAISRLAAAEVPVDAAFDDIITQNPHMQELKVQATVLADRDVPVLIYGESGTGKELFARAIHNASSRAGKAFVAVNCGAFPGELIDSILFGHKKGTFTGATADKPGVFTQADGGTLFLDEFGELEPAVQVRLLRVLQDGSFTPLGTPTEQKVDIRLVTATNKNLMVEVSENRFREDLFYRIAVGVLHLPPLRERQGDITLLAETLLKAIGSADNQLNDKIISVEAKKIILQQSWQGNVRELHSTLLRAALWTQGNNIDAADLERALFRMPEKEVGLLGRDVSKGIDFKVLFDEVVRHYVPRVMTETGGNKSRAAKLMGFTSYQTLDNWMKKYRLK